MTGPSATEPAAETRFQLDPRTVRVALIALFLGGAALGSSPIFVRLSELEPTATAFHRVFLAMPALWLWSQVQGRTDTPRRPSGLRDYAGLALAGVFFAGDLGFWHWSLRFTTVANATLLANFAPIFVTLGGFLLFGERFSRRFLVGMALAMAGACLLVVESFNVSMRNVFGDGLGLVTGMFFGLYILTVGRLRAHFSTVTIMTWSSAATAAVLLPVTLLFGEPLMAMTLYGWLVLLGLALITHVGGQGLVAYALAHLPAAFSSVGLLIEPVVAAILAWILFGEALGGWQAAGAGVILAGIVLARRGSR